MEIIPKCDMPGKDELAIIFQWYLESDLVNAYEYCGQIDKNIERRLYVSDSSCESGDIFFPGDFC